MSLLKEILKNLVSRPFTERFPREMPKLPHGVKGKIKLDVEKCIFCGLCEKVCPSKAIEVDNNKKTLKIELSKCLLCCECVKICPKRALKLTKEFPKPDELILTFKKP